MILENSSYSSCSVMEMTEVTEMRQELDKKMKESNALQEGFGSALQRLERLRELSSFEGWDGENAEPVNLTSYSNARKFLFQVPWGIVAPDPGIDINGQMTLEWRKSDGKLLSLTFDEKDKIHYIFFLGAERIYGNRPISSGYEDTLKDLLEKIVKD